MKVNIISIFFPPEGGAAASRIFNMAKSLQARGVDVEVITALPNYPTGKIFEQYSGKFVAKEEIDGIKCRRYWLYPSNSRNPVLRIWSMVSFSVSMLFALPYLWARSPDLLIINSPPLVTGFFAVIMAKFTRAKAVTNISDIWPLSALELGAIQRGGFYSLLEKIEYFLYKNSYATLTQSQETLEHIKALVPQQNLFLYRNLDEPSPYLEQGAAYEKTELKIVYAGLLGIAQGVFDICKNVDFKALGVQLHIYGAGNEWDDIQNYIKTNPDCNISLNGMIPKRDVPKMLSEFHATLIPLNTPIYGAFPSKIFMAISSGLPVFFSGSGEGAKVVADYGLGWINEPADYAVLAQNIQKFTTLTDTEFQTIKQNCIAASQTDFNREQQNDALLTYLKQLI
jgi:glycosyltransferase involved in cell wall biosynthesis